jgi:hypothetical protein
MDARMHAACRGGASECFSFTRGGLDEALLGNLMDLEWKPWQDTRRCDRVDQSAPAVDDAKRCPITVTPQNGHGRDGRVPADTSDRQMPRGPKKFDVFDDARIGKDSHTKHLEREASVGGTCQRAP